MNIADVDAQGRPDLLNSERALKRARDILNNGWTIHMLADELIRREQHGLAIGRNEIGPGSPYPKD